MNTFIRKDLARKTIKNYMLIVNQIFEHALECGDIDVSPCNVKMPKNLPEKIREPATEKEEKIIKSHPEYLLPYLVIYTGCRLGEALALQDTDIKDDKIYITKSVYFKNHAPYLKEPKTKSGIRCVPLLDPLNPYVPTTKTGKYIFSKTNGESPLKCYQFEKYYNKFRKETGVKSTIHQLRHSYATMLFECEISPKDAQALLGHASLAMTMDIYTKWRENRIDGIAKNINNKLKNTQ